MCVCVFVGSVGVSLLEISSNEFVTCSCGERTSYFAHLRLTLLTFAFKIIDLTLERRRNSAHEVHEEIECKAFTPEDTLLDMIDAIDAS